MDGPLVLAGKNAKKLGDCQCVMPGRMILSTSRSIASNGSPCSGACGGSAARISPGFTGDITGSDSTRFR
jgi:hypothetical protein